MTYLKRYWPLLLLFLFLLPLAVSDRIFALVGTFGYVPCLMVLLFLSVLLVRNVFNSRTSDWFVDSGEHDDAFRAMTPFQRFHYTFWERIAYLIAGAIVLHAAVG